MKASPTASLDFDARSLDALRSEASKDPKAATRQAAVQFESLLMQQVIKSMRDANPKGESSPGQDNFTQMLDTQLAKQFSGRPGGLADVLEKQLSQHMQNLPAVSPENTAAAAAAAAANAAANNAANAMPLRKNFTSPSTTSLSSVTSTRATGSTKGTTQQAEFIDKLTPHAKEAERQTGVPASFILGQAALESGWGKGEMRNADGSNSFNLFGVKAGGSWRGATTKQMTTEYEGGQAVRQREEFRSYSSYTEAFADYARMLSSNKRYGGVVRSATTAESFAGGMQRAGYATDPHYAQKLARTINTTVALQRSRGWSATA